VNRKHLGQDLGEQNLGEQVPGPKTDNFALPRGPSLTSRWAKAPSRERPGRLLGPANWSVY